MLYAWLNSLNQIYQVFTFYFKILTTWSICLTWALIISSKCQIETLRASFKSFLGSHLMWCYYWNAKRKEISSHDNVIIYPKDKDPTAFRLGFWSLFLLPTHQVSFFFSFWLTGTFNVWKINEVIIICGSQVPYYSAWPTPSPLGCGLDVTSPGRLVWAPSQLSCPCRGSDRPSLPLLSYCLNTLWQGPFSDLYFPKDFKLHEGSNVLPAPKVVPSTCRVLCKCLLSEWQNKCITHCM